MRKSLLSIVAGVTLVSAVGCSTIGDYLLPGWDDVNLPVGCDAYSSVKSHELLKAEQAAPITTVMSYDNCIPVIPGADSIKTEDNYSQSI